MRNYRLRKLFYFGCQNAQRHFLDFITNIQNRANFLNLQRPIDRSKEHDTPYQNAYKHAFSVLKSHH
ncbi:hypothetical protein DD771_01530 [Helicobacter pylori]|nr:hypothetical protein DD771_01530 [Helicobacter pylori]